MQKRETFYQIRVASEVIELPGKEQPVKAELMAMKVGPFLFLTMPGEPMVEYGFKLEQSIADRATPVMLHRAIVGSFQRFIGILIEEHAGALPVWLAPVQVVVTAITDLQADYAQEVSKSLQKQGVRVITDMRNEKISYKIREHSMQKVPYILVVGDKEKANGSVAVRARGNQDLGVMSVADFSLKLSQDIVRKA